MDGQYDYTPRAFLGFVFVMKNATHGLLESRSEEFSGFVHQIAGL